MQGKGSKSAQAHSSLKTYTILDVLLTPAPQTHYEALLKKVFHPA